MSADERDGRRDAPVSAPEADLIETSGVGSQVRVYGPVAAEHLRHPRNLGRIADADGVGEVDDPSSDTLLTVYLRLGRQSRARPVVEEARFRAFGCSGSIIAGSIATELATGITLDDIPTLDASAINAALDDGLPPEQRYCADLAARALQLAAGAAAG
jgi:nitrogen fixation NifU-like protein